HRLKYVHILRCSSHCWSRHMSDWSCHTRSVQTMIHLKPSFVAASDDEDRRSAPERCGYRSFAATCDTRLLTSSCAFTVGSVAVTVSSCFSSRAMVTSCSSFFRCSLRNSLSTILPHHPVWYGDLL